MIDSVSIFTSIWTCGGRGQPALVGTDIEFRWNRWKKQKDGERNRKKRRENKRD